MALDDSDFAQIRRMTDSAVEKALDRQAQALGARDAEDLARNRDKYLRGSEQDRAHDREREPARESEAERKLRERDEADAKAAKDAAAAADKAAREADKAARDAEIQKAKDDAAAEVAATKARLMLETKLLRKDVTEDSLDIVRIQYERELAALPEADRAKDIDIDQFLIRVAQRAPGFFAEGKAPQEHVETPEEKATREAAEAAAHRSGQGTGPAAKDKVVIPAKEDFSTGKSLKELRERAAKLGN